MKDILLTIDNNAISSYSAEYFVLHPKASKMPIKHPYHEQINTWMIMKRPAMNALKGKWKKFIVWLIDSMGYTNLHIEKCEMIFSAYYPNNRRHDPDNSVPKFILDGLVESGMIVDDDQNHITRLTLECGVDTQNPRTEIHILVKEIEGEENEEKG